MKLKIYQIDAFADRVFSGNPAAVCILEEWLDDSLMQQIAAENNLAETAFAVPQDNQYELRWFTPEIEVDLCGHATLATAYVIFNYYGYLDNALQFYSPRSGQLSVEKSNDGLMTLDFPTDDLEEIGSIEAVNQAMRKTPLQTYRGKTDYLIIYETQDDVEELKPNFHLLDQIDCRGVIASSKGKDVDFVSRFFAPKCGIPEDPVTGSAHTTLTPYWSKKLNKTNLTAKQLSQRGGELQCEYLGERVKISGKAVPYLIGEIEI